ncbi:MAG TPA: hypothetical protein VE690_18655 [Rhodopila sp.]|nr:hypothetical protein [Rhodopila sp.]
MRFSASTAANAIAWAVVAVLAAFAILIASLFGFAGLMLLGVMTWLVCTRAELDQDTPTWGVQVFKAKFDSPASPEQRAAMTEERHAFVSPLRFYSRCGIFLAAIGAAGFIWQQWNPGNN